MGRSSTRKRLIVGLTTVAAVLSAGVTLAIASGSSSTPQPAAVAPVSQVASPGAAVASELAVLKRPRTAADALPAAAEATRWESERHFGANGALARRVRTSPQVYLIPSQEGACMFNATGVQNFCATASQIENGEAVEAALCAPGLPTDEIELGGILPDGVYNASVTLSDGSAVPLAVEGDTYVADFSRTGPLPTELVWDTADGQRHVASADVPGSAASEYCVAPSS